MIQFHTISYDVVEGNIIEYVKSQTRTRTHTHHTHMHQIRDLHMTSWTRSCQGPGKVEGAEGRCVEVLAALALDIIPT